MLDDFSTPQGKKEGKGDSTTIPPETQLPLKKKKKKVVLNVDSYLMNIIVN